LVSEAPTNKLSLLNLTVTEVAQHGVTITQMVTYKTIVVIYNMLPYCTPVHLNAYVLQI